MMGTKFWESAIWILFKEGFSKHLLSGVVRFPVHDNKEAWFHDTFAEPTVTYREAYLHWRYDPINNVMRVVVEYKKRVRINIPGEVVKMDQVEFSFNGDDTIIEFRNRVQEQFKNAQLVFEDPAYYTAVAASLWFSMELYEDRVRAQIEEKGPVPPLELVNLHNLVHQMRGVLEQMFEAVGMRLTDIPMACPPKI